MMKLPFERTQTNLHRFIEMNTARGKPVEIHVSLIPTEHHSPDEIERFRSYWGPRVNLSPIHIWPHATLWWQARE